MRVKILSSVICSTIISLGICFTASAEETLESAVNDIWMSNHPEICENVVKYFNDDVKQYSETIWDDEGLKHKYGYGGGYDYYVSVKSNIRHYTKIMTPLTDKGYKFYHLNTQKYSVQYAENKNIDYLLDESWLVHIVMFNNNQEPNSWCVFDSTADKCINNSMIELIASASPVIPTALYDFVKDGANLSRLLKEAGAEDFIDFKVIDVNSVNTVLYFKYSNGEFGILINDADNNTNSPDIEMMKVYDFSYILRKIGETSEMGIGGRTIYTADMLANKSTYESEAKELYNMGLLQGNEKGLDLLKPLTRAEAVTLLVRALGKENEVSKYTVSGFSDIASDNWAAPYAALAKAKGITDGVSKTEFAPDMKVTSDQFSTFVLRASGEKDVDYTQATQLLIDRGIITAEEAETMDLFTRGDMAKIIYEAHEKGLL